MTIQEAQQAVDQWIKTYGVRYFSELTNMAVLTEEVGNMVTKASSLARKKILARRWPMCYGYCSVWLIRRVST